ncbi:hypothetical protein LCGC14_1718420 [marine sediment metagenome]|uniref:Uncharacterized protein n=1 Tax=marine sediment metagenome TaxID=412755 RepID=A0A0F9I0T8_9ZZZZ
MVITVTQLQQIVNTIGISTCFVKALVGLSRPARMALKMQLNRSKRALKAELATYAFKSKIAARKQVEINKVFSSASAILSQQKRVLHLLNIGPEFNDCAEVQKLINSLLSLANVKGISLGGYRDAENILNALNFEAQQIAKSIDFAENVVETVNTQIDSVDKYIKVLDAIDSLS